MQRNFNGSNLKKYREKAGWTQLELAEKVNEEYKTHIVDVSSIARWEHSTQAKPRNSKLVKVAKVLSIPVEVLFDVVAINDRNEIEDEIITYNTDNEVEEVVSKHNSEYDAHKLSIMEWNIHARGGSEFFFPKFVPETILRINPDIAVLTEFFIGYNFDFFRSIESKFNFYISPFTGIGRNQVAVLVRKNREIVVSNVISINPLDNEKPEFLHLKLKLFGDKKISVIGLRIKSEGKKLEEQVDFMNHYLNSLTDDFACVGDFNARHNYLHDKIDFNVISPKHDKDKYYSRNWLDNYSHLFVNNEKNINGGGDLDHAIIKKGNASLVKYNWDFLKLNKAYPLKEEIIKGTRWEIPVGYPDHAIFTFDYHID